VAAALAAVALSCAYYNIMWTANREYDKAAESLPYAGFWDPYEQEKPAGDALKLLDSAASRCGKLLVLYPDSKWADDALLVMGKCFLLAQDYDKAIKKFREVSTLYAGGDLAEEAKYLEAYTLILQGSPDLAVQPLQNLASQAKNDKVREKATYLGARIAFERGDCLNAIDSYAAYLDEYSDGERAGSARLAMSKCLLKLGMYNEVIEDLKPLMNEPDAQGMLALLRVGRAYRMLGDESRAMSAFERVLADAPDDTLRARAGIDEAAVRLDGEQYEEAIATLVLADSLGGKKLSGEINYRIGLIYERNIEDFDQAITHYDESIKKKSDFTALAAKRSSALKNVKKYEEEIASGTGDVARSRYLLAETYMYDLGMKEHAKQQLLAVADSFPDSEYAARSMLAVAAYLRDEGDSSAVSYYRRILENFPGTPYANVARVALGMPCVDVSIETPAPAAADTAGAPVAAGARTSIEIEGPPAPPQGTRRPARPCGLYGRVSTRSAGTRDPAQSAGLRPRAL
jgi:TolA-binding protein